MSSGRPWHSYVEEANEAGQARPNTRRPAQVPTKGLPSNHYSKRTYEPSKQGPQQIEVNNRDKNSEQSAKESSKMSYRPPIPNAWGYPQNLPLDPASYDPYYYPNGLPPTALPAQAIPPQGVLPQTIPQHNQSAIPSQAIPFAGLMHPPPPPQQPAIQIPYAAPAQHTQLAYRPRPPPSLYAPPQSPGEYFPSSASGQRYRPLAVSPYQTQQSVGLSSYMHPPESPIHSGHPMSIDEYVYPPQHIPDTSGRLASRFSPRERLLQKDPILRTESAHSTRDTKRPSKQTIDKGWFTGISESNHLRDLRPTDKKAYTRASTPMPREEFPKVRSESPPQLTRSKSLRRSSESFHDARDSYDYFPKSPGASRPQRQTASHDLNHKSEKVRFGPTSSHHRRQSWADMPRSYESKLKHANSYLEEVKGPSGSTPLTAASLRQQSRHHSSTRTRSSSSQDDSDYRQSETSRTSRSGSANEDENMTIKVTGGSARVTVGGAQIDCNKGGAIEIKRDKVPRGSERAFSEYAGARQAIEDRERRNRPEKITGRPRGNSQSHRSSGRHRDYNSAYHT